MKAIVITNSEGPESLRVQDVADPVPGPSELLIRVRATALNRADLLQTLGLYPAPPDAPKDIPGLEYAGEVVAVGPRVSRYKIGDRVMGIVGGGAFAELLLCHERESMPIPPGMSFTDAAAIPEAFLTAFDALVLQAGLRAGENVLISAAGSGVGTAATQVANAFGATVIGTARTPSKLEKLRELGMHHGISTGDDGLFADEVKKITHGRGVDVVLDLVSGPTVNETLAALAPKARWVLVGMMAGAQAEIDLALLMRKRAHLVGTVLRSRPLEEKIAVAQAAERTLLPLFEGKKLRPVVDTVHPMSKLQEAFTRLSSNASLGKIVLEWT
ncbi:MAG: NAD(P)H-quinone oxidoreductase [Myxococcaceae bacterium]